MIKIPLTQNKVALIDDEDFELVNRYKWYAHTERGTGLWYAWHELCAGAVWRMHRLILNAKESELVDHRDMDGLNNQKYNLRLCNKSQNMCNSGSRAGSRSQYKGVSWSKQEQKWVAQIMKNYIQHRLGYFDTEIEAALAYDFMAPKLHGEFARLNFPDHLQ